MGVLQDLAAGALRVLDPEQGHELALKALRAELGPWARPDRFPRLKTSLAGLELSNPIGLAAGFDKNCVAPDAMLAAGFGFVECGTVTPRPQAGNAKPRLFRLSEDRSVINRMGFNNEGLDAFVPRLAQHARAERVIGANVGANKNSDDRIADYVEGLTRVWEHASYVTANISSPNTPGLRGLQERGALEDLLGRLNEARAALTVAHGARPLFLKVAPDLDDTAVRDIAEVVTGARIDALIVSNTTLERPPHLTSEFRDEAGGLSGQALFRISNRALRHFAAALDGTVPLIGAGGVESGLGAYVKIRSGATAVQLYSALVFEGPGLIARILEDLDALLHADGFTSVTQAIGAR